MDKVTRPSLVGRLLAAAYPNGITADQVENSVRITAVLGLVAEAVATGRPFGGIPLSLLADASQPARFDVEPVVEDVEDVADEPVPFVPFVPVRPKGHTAARGIDWSRESRLGKMPDRALAKLLSVSVNTVTVARRKFGIEPFGRGRPARSKPSAEATPDVYQGPTIVSGALTKAERAAGIELISDGTEPARPKVRADCVNGPRPCPWVSCRHHLAVDARPTANGYGSLTLVAGTDDLSALPETCALDVADRGEHTLEAVSAILGVTRERVRQEVASAVDKLKSRDVEALR